MFADPIDKPEPPPRNYVKTSPFSPIQFTLQTLLFVTIGGGSLYLAIWQGEWIGAALGGFAAVCVYLPIFGWFEFKQEKAVVDHANGMIQGHRVATEAWMERVEMRRLTAAQAWLQAEREKDQQLIEQANAERDILAKRLEPSARPRQRDARGKYLPVKSKQVRNGSEKVAPPIASDPRPHPTPLLIDGDS